MQRKVWLALCLLTCSFTMQAEPLINEESCSALYSEIKQTETKEARDKLIRRYADNCITSSSLCLSVDCSVDSTVEAVSDIPPAEEMPEVESYDPSIVSAPSSAVDKCADLIHQINELKGHPQKKFALQQEYDLSCGGAVEDQLMQSPLE